MDPVVIGGIGTAIGAVGAVLVNIIKAAHGRNQNRKDQLEHEERLVELSSSMTNVNQAISEIRISMNEAFNEVRNSIDKLDRKLDDFAAEEKQINIVSLRHSITQVFHTYKDKKEIPAPIYQSTLNLYDQYKQLGGNSFVSDEIEEMKSWKKV